MKNLVEQGLHPEFDSALHLRRQFVEREWEKNKRPAGAAKNPMLVPFLLSIPVIILVGILGLHWSRQATAGPVTSQLASPRMEAFPPEKPLVHPSPVRTIVASHPSTVLAPNRDTVVKATKTGRAKTAGRNNRGLGTGASPPLEQLVRIQPSYQVNKGRILDLKLSVSNISPSLLDLVIIELTYQNLHNQPPRKEIVYLKNIPSGGNALALAPDGGFAEKLSYKISLVSAKEANLYLVSR